MASDDGQRQLASGSDSTRERRQKWMGTEGLGQPGSINSWTAQGKESISREYPEKTSHPSRREEAGISINSPPNSSKVPKKGRVKALTARFDSLDDGTKSPKPTFNYSSATLPARPKIHLKPPPTEGGGVVSRSSAATVQRRKSSRKNASSHSLNSGGGGGKSFTLPHRVSSKGPSVPLYKNRPGISRRQSTAIKKSSTHPSFRSVAGISVPRSKSAQARVAEVIELLEQNHKAVIKDQRTQNPPPPKPTILPKPPVIQPEIPIPTISSPSEQQSVMPLESLPSMNDSIRRHGVNTAENEPSLLESCLREISFLGSDPKYGSRIGAGEESCSGAETKSSPHHRSDDPVPQGQKSPVTTSSNAPEKFVTPPTLPRAPLSELSKPQTLPKPSFLPIASSSFKSKKANYPSQALSSPEYAEYDSTFSNWKDARDKRETLSGESSDPEGNIYCSLNNSPNASTAEPIPSNNSGDHCSPEAPPLPLNPPPSLRPQLGNEHGKMGKVVLTSVGSPTVLKSPATPHHPTPSAEPKTTCAENPPPLPRRNGEVMTPQPKNSSPKVPPPVAPKTKRLSDITANNQALWNSMIETSSRHDDSGDYEKIADRGKLQESFDGSSASWETGSSISSQDPASSGPQLVSWRKKDSSDDYEATPRATIDSQTEGITPISESPEHIPHHMFASHHTGMKRKIPKGLAKKLRPMSQPSFDMDKFLRIKSDFSLNFAKKMGKLKVKISQPKHHLQGAEYGSSKGRSSMFVVTDPHSPTHPDQDANCSTASTTPNDELNGTIEICWRNGEEDHDFDSDWSDTEDEASEVEEEEQAVDEEHDEKHEESVADSEPEPTTPPPHLPDVVSSSVRQSNGNRSFLHSSVTSAKPPLPPASPKPTITSEDLENGNGHTECETEEPSEAPSVTTSTVAPKEAEVEEEKATSNIPIANNPSSPDLELDLEPTYISRLVPTQPLYQHYQRESTAIALKIARNESLSSTSTGGSGGSDPQADDSESVVAPSTNASVLSSASGRWHERRQRLVGSSKFGSQRSLWCEMPEVRRIGVLDSLGDQEKKRQEATFEVLTSEASYLRSLNFLITHFMAASALSGKPELSSVIGPRERKNLFSNILAVRDCSEKLLSALEKLFEENVVLGDICDILCDHFTSDFDVYVKYCSNQIYQDRILKGQKLGNPAFQEAITQLEADPQCEGLDMRSFLMLPMQRITRYPLLVDAIVQRTENNNGTPGHENARKALALAHKVVTQCNEGARRMERMEHLLDIDRRLIYPTGDLRKVPLVSAGRYLVKNSAFTQLLRTESPVKAIRKPSIGALAMAAGVSSRRKTKPLHIFLFTDILIVTKKSGVNFIVKDYCARQFVEVCQLELNSPLVPIPALASLTSNASTKPYLFMCTLMNNARGKQMELVLSTDSETDRARWLEALSPPPQPEEEEGGAIYAIWDCPEFIAEKAFHPSQEDELGLEPGDAVKVLRRMPDGWCEGERLRDGVRGWFPGTREYVVEILSDHIRARNYRQRLRLIQAAETLQSTGTSSPVGPNPPITSTPTNPNSTPASPFRRGIRRLSNTKGLFS